MCDCAELHTLLLFVLILPQVFDSDGSGSIDLDEALLMIHNVHSTSRFCDCCSSNLSPLEDGGYCCSKCYEEMQVSKYAIDDDVLLLLLLPSTAALAAGPQG